MQRYCGAGCGHADGGARGGTERITVAADKAYDTKDFVKEMRGMNVTPHVSQNTKRSGGSAIDGRTTRHEGYQVSQRKRKRIEEVFGWIKPLARSARLGIAGWK
jgi:IS5 family transposase